MSKFSKLSEEEVAFLVSLLRRVTPLPKMERPVLKAIWEARLMPMNPIELVILAKNFTAPLTSQWVLLAYRRDDVDFPDCWHLPGGYLGANERIIEAANRVAEREIGVTVFDLKAVSMGNFYGLARDHEFSLLAVCRLKEDLKENQKLKWFSLENLPKDLLPHHQLAVEKVKIWLEFGRQLYLKDEELYDLFLRLSSVLESDFPK